jgi:TPR repeat protein
MTDKPEGGQEPKSIEPDESWFFSDTLPRVESVQTHHMTINPELDRPGSNRLKGYDEGAPFFTAGVSGVREGHENAMLLLAKSTNALSETDVERRVARLQEAIDLMELVKDDQNAASIIEMQKGILFGSMAATLMARREGSASQNRKDAIANYQRAMEHFVLQKDQPNVVKTKYNLADAYAAGVISDDRSDGKLALSYLREVIAEAPATGPYPLGRAARLNFASLAERLFAEDSSGASVIEEAIGYSKEVAAAASEGEDLSMWSSAMNTLGALYARRSSGDRRSNLQQAIRHFEEALKGHSNDELSFQRNPAQANLLSIKRVYAREFERERSDDALREYIAHREVKIADLTEQGKLLLAADEKIGLARDLIFSSGGEEQDVERAHGLINDAFVTLSERNAVAEMVDALELLHFAELRLGYNDAAAAHGWLALKTSQRLEEGGVELERVRELSQKLKGLDARTAILFLSSGETALALDTLEYGRARFLRSAMNMRGVESEQQITVGKLRAKVIALDREISKTNNAPREMVERFIEARRELAALQEQFGVPPGSPLETDNDFRRTWRVIERLMQTYSAIVVPIFDGDRCAICVLALEGKELRASTVFSEQDPRPLLQRWRATDWDDAVARKATIEAVTTELWDLFGHSAAGGLVRRKVAFGSRVAIVPQGEFGQLPLALARDPQMEPALCDLFELSFAPSIAALDRAPFEPQPPTLAAIINPTLDLPFTPIEALTGVAIFRPVERGTYLFGTECTKAGVLAALRSGSHWLFSAHGEFDQADARSSGLRLSNDERLELDDLLTLSDLRPPRLVILSACETGVHAVKEAADEFVGLPVGFLQLGAEAVVATLWPVSDASTALFVSAFMTSHVQRGNRPAFALRDAQCWVREATAQQIRDTLVTYMTDEVPPDTAAALQAFDKMLAGIDPSECVFEHPYYWGGFILYGA